MLHTRGDRTKLGLALLLAGSFLAGCLKRDGFPEEPRIVYKSFAQFGDSASFIISFTDGDGDVGLDASDNASPFDTSSPYYHNLFLEMDTVRNGVWGQVDFALPLYYRIPRITPTGQNKALEGEIAVAVSPWPIITPTTAPWDSVRFRARMFDRALHESNAVMSEAIRVAQ